MLVTVNEQNKNQNNNKKYTNKNTQTQNREQQNSTFFLSLSSENSKNLTKSRLIISVVGRILQA